MSNDLLNMKRLMIFTIVFSILSASAFSQMSDSGRRRMSGSSNAPMDYMMLFDYAGIMLSDGQKSTMSGCIGRYDSETKGILIEIRDLNNSVRNELVKDKPDRKAIRGYIEKKKQKEAVIEYMNIDRDITILETLTAEQRVMFYDYQERMRTRMRHGGGGGHMMQ